MDNITASEVAGLAVGALLLSATIAAPKIDVFFSSSQRSSLGLCKRCGNVGRMACAKCKGTGSIKEGGLLSFNVIDDLFETISDRKSQVKKIACVNCQARGYFPCPDCSKL